MGETTNYYDGYHLNVDMKRMLEVYATPQQLLPRDWVLYTDTIIGLDVSGSMNNSTTESEPTTKVTFLNKKK